MGAQARDQGTVGVGSSVVTDADNSASRHFLQAVLAGNGKRATVAEIERLAKAADSLPPGAAYMVAQVTMGSAAAFGVTPADVARGLRAMAPAALDALRSE